MEKIDKILVAVEANDGACDALTKAVTLARRFGAQLELFLCDAERAFALEHQYDFHGVEHARQSCLAHSRQYLESLHASVDTSGVYVMIDAACESPEYAAISGKIARAQPDLVVRNVSGTRGEQLPELSAADWDLVRTCAVPLLLTRGVPWKRHPKIAAAIDVTNAETPHLTQQILRTANYLSAGCDGEIEVLYSDPDPTHAGNPQALAAARTRVRACVDDAAVPVEGLHVLAGDPVQVVPEFVAKQGYELLVVGALTHRQALSALVGSLTGKLLEGPVCDFLLVRAEAAGSALAADAPILSQRPVEQAYR